jgi:hypothetical protein
LESVQQTLESKKAILETKPIFLESKHSLILELCPFNQQNLTATRKNLSVLKR